MKQLRWVFFSLIIVPFGAQASELNWSMTNEEKRSEISLAFETAKLEVEDEEINSYGGKIGYKYHLWKRIDVDAFLASTMSTADGLKPGSTTIGLYGMFNLFESGSISKSVSIGGETLLSENNQVLNQFRVGAGFEQTFLSGNKGVYSAAGPGLQLNYEHSFYNTKFFVGGRYAVLQSGDIEVKATMFNLGLFLDY